MDILLNSFLLVFASEMGDKTQLLSLMLVSKYRKPWVIFIGVFVATLLNHSLASFFGAWVSTLVEPKTLSWFLGAAFIAFAFWVLIPDKQEDLQESTHFGVLVSTIIIFFLAEMGDKTQIATTALSARYSSIYLVSCGTTLGMMASNAIVIFFGNKFLKRVSLDWARRIASLLFLIFGMAILLANFYDGI